MTPPISDASFRGLLEAAPDGMLLVNQRGVVVLANAQIERLFGYSKEEIVGQRVEILMPDRFRSMHVTHRQVYQDRPDTRSMGSQLELSGRRKDGSEFPVEISLSPGVSEDGALVTAAVRDVTEKKRTEETLRRSEARYRLLAEHAQDLIFRLDLTCSPPEFEYVSPSATLAAGYSPEDFYSDPALFSRILHPDDRQVWEESITCGENRVVTLRGHWPGDELRWSEYKLVPVSDANGTVVAVEGIARDITERREIEEEQRRLASEIETQLEREQIARDLHDDIVQSTYAVGLSLHAARSDQSISKETLVDRAIVDLNAVIADLRTFMEHLGSRGMNSADEVLEVRIKALLAAAPVRPEWSSRFSFGEFGSEEGRQLYLIAKELISNVLRHAKARNARFSLGSDGESILLSVSDDGAGFDRDQRRPTSFGLHSMEQRASDLGGTMTVRTSPGTGTTVEVRLPSRPPSAQRPATERVTADGGTTK